MLLYIIGIGQIYEILWREAVEKVKAFFLLCVTLCILCDLCVIVSQELAQRSQSPDSYREHRVPLRTFSNPLK
jgi:hypothetical protein